MTTLNLFPARIRFTNADGTLTPEAYRALQALFQRVGGALGDNGTDVFAVFGGGDMDATIGEVSARETVMQPPSVDECGPPDLSQPVECDLFFPDVVQPAGGNTMDEIVVKAGTAALPSITTEGDENTGVFFPAANSVGVTTDGVERFRVGTTGNVGVAAAKRIYLDGVAGTGDTYLVESAANTVQLVVGGTARLTITTTGVTLANNTTIQGVTATGATGTGNLVFGTSPTLTTPNLGTPSALVGTNITGTAAGLTAGALVAGSGVTGTFTTFTSVTFSNGIATAYIP